MDSDGYYSTYVPAFTAKEKTKLKELFGKGYPHQDDLSDEQVQRILTRIGPSLRQGMKTEDVLHFLKYRCVLTETEVLHLRSGSIQPQEQALRLLEHLMYRGSYGIGCLYLCLMDSSEQEFGLPAHYQLAGELKQIVQTECGVSPYPPKKKDVSGDFGLKGYKPHALHKLIRRLPEVPLDAETATTFLSNLGLEPQDFPEPPDRLMKTCDVWLEKRSLSCDLDELIKALVYTKLLGRYTTRLCAPYDVGASPELHNFIQSLGPKWVQVAAYLGFTAEEVAEITSSHSQSNELQVTEFLKLWRVPECGLRTLPLLHRLKALAGIVEPRNPGRELNNRPGMPGYYNKHLKTDIHGSPHRSLDTYSQPHSATSSHASMSSPPSTSFPSGHGRGQALPRSRPRGPAVGRMGGGRGVGNSDTGRQPQGHSFGVHPEPPRQPRTSGHRQSKAEEVCVKLTEEYEERLAAVHHSMDESHQEIARLKAEKELYEENMKKAFMRGVCALNLEAMTMFRQHDSPDGPPSPTHTNGHHHSSLVPLSVTPGNKATITVTVKETHTVENTPLITHPLPPPALSQSSQWRCE